MKSRKPHLQLVAVQSEQPVATEKFGRSNVAVLEARRAENTKIVDMFSWQPMPPAAA